MSRDDAAALLRENAKLREEVGRLLEASRALAASHEATLHRLERHDAIRRSMCLRTTALADAPGQNARRGLFKLMSGSATTKVERLRPADAQELLAWHRTGYSYKAGSLCSFDAAEVRSEDGKVFSGSLLHAAAFEGNPYTVAVLVDAIGLPVDDEDLLGRTPAHIAAMEGQHFALRTLLARGADPLAEDAAGQTPLSLAWFRVRSDATLKRGWRNEDMVVMLQDAVDRERETGSRDSAEPFPDPAEMAEILKWDSDDVTQDRDGAKPDATAPAAGDDCAAADGDGAPVPAAAASSSPQSASNGAAAPPPSTPRSRVARFAADGPNTPSLFKSPGAALWFGSGSARKRARTPGSAAPAAPLVFTPIEAVPAPLARLPALAARLGHLLLVRDTVRGARAKEEFDRRIFVLCTEATAAAKQLPPGDKAAGHGSATGSALQALMDRTFALAFPPAAVAATVLFDPSTRRSRAFEAAIGVAMADLPPSDRGAWAEGVRGMSCAIGMPEGTGSPYRSQLWFAVLTIDRRGRFPAQGPPQDRERLQPRVTLEQINCPEGSGVDKSVLDAISAQVLSPTSPYLVEAVVGPLSRRQGSAVVSQWRAAINAALAASRCDADCDKTGRAIADAAELASPTDPSHDPLPVAIAAAVLPSGFDPALDEATASTLRTAARLARRSPHALRCPSRAGAGFCEASAVQAGKAAAETLDLLKGSARFKNTGHFGLDRSKVLWREATAHAASAATTGAEPKPPQRLAFKHMFSPGAVPHSPVHASATGTGKHRHHLTPFPLSRAAGGRGWGDVSRDGEVDAASPAIGARSTGMASAVSVSLSARAAALRDTEDEDGASSSPSASFDADAVSPPGATPARDLSAVMQQAAVSPVSAVPNEVAEPVSGEGDGAESLDDAEPVSDVRQVSAAGMFGGSDTADEETVPREPGPVEPAVQSEPVAGADVGRSGRGADDAWAESDDDWSLGAMEGLQGSDEAAGAAPIPGSHHAGADAEEEKEEEKEEGADPSQMAQGDGVQEEGVDAPSVGDAGVVEEAVSASSMFGGPDEASDRFHAAASPALGGAGAGAVAAEPVSALGTDDMHGEDQWGDADWDMQESPADQHEQEEEAEEEEEEEDSEAQDASASMLEAASAVTSSLFQAWKDVTGQGAPLGDQGDGMGPEDTAAEQTEAGDDEADPAIDQSVEPVEEGPSAASFFGEEEAGDGWAGSAFEDDSWNTPAVGGAAAQDAAPAEDAEVEQEQEQAQEQEQEGPAPASTDDWDQGWAEADEPGNGGGASAFPPLSPSDGTTPTGQAAGSFFEAPAEADGSATAGGAGDTSQKEEGGSGGAALSSFFEGEAGDESAAGGLFSSAPAPSPEAMTTQVMHAVTDIMDAHEQPSASAASFFDDGGAVGTPSGLNGDDFIAPDSSDDW